MANGFKLGESLSPPSLSPNKVLITNNTGKAETSAITTSELNALSGIQGNIQEQINNIGGVSIDDTAASTSTVYSSSKTEDLINSSLTQLLDRFYPVGCIVMSFVDMSDAQVIERYGGTTWERIRERYLIAAGSSSHIVGSTGGSSTVTLTENNLPEHSHTYINTIVGNRTLTISQIPSHSHSSYDSAVPWGSDWHDSERQMTCRSSSERSWAPTTGTAGGGGSHTHGDTSQSRTTNTAGSGTAFSIEPPYIAVYMWRRTA